MPINTVLEGPLSKWTNMLSGWQYRWFVLDPLNGLLSYYTSKENMSKGERRGCIRLNKGAVYVGYDNEDDITFTITVDEKTFHLQARNLDEREKWVNKIDRTIRYHATTSSSSASNDKSQLFSSDDAMNSMMSSGDLDTSLTAAAASVTLNMSNFDTELAESDAYLQLLIEQLKVLQMKRAQLLQQQQQQPPLPPTQSQPQQSSSSSSSAAAAGAAAVENKSSKSSSQASETGGGGENGTGSGSSSGSNSGGGATVVGASNTELNILDPNLDSYDGSSSGVDGDLDTYTEADDETFQAIINATESLIETLKHAIICLQIAKANSDPNSSVGEIANDLNEVISNFNKSHTTPSDSLNSSFLSSETTTTTTTGAEGSRSNNRNNQQEELRKKLSQLKPLAEEQIEKQKTLSSSSSSSEPTTSRDRHRKTTAAAAAAAAFKSSGESFKSYSSSDEEKAGRLDQRDATKSKASSASLPQAGSNTTLSKVRKSGPTTVHRNIDDDDDDEENLSDYFNDDDDDDDDDQEPNYRRKSRAEDNDSESFYDAIDPTMTVTSYSSIATTTSTTGNSEMYHQAAVVSRVLCGEEAKSKDSAMASSSATDTTSTNATATTAMMAIKCELESKSGPASSTGHVHPEGRLIVIDNKPITDSELYDDDALPEEIDLNNQQSVITHLLTQVRIGMDLTKITLPTFILEPRSLLEMYADFFAHTDLFLEIVDKKNAHDRMLQVMKWYVSTLHAGRKSPVAKKPYNPILGEIFQCWYSVPPNDSSASSSLHNVVDIDKTVVDDGPVKWSTRDQLSFIAEQVSHHPPISAFYAENYNKRIQIDGYTWTKSKFLGLSIGVHFVGKAVLSLLDYDEEYIMTFPSAYGRSILTVPWFEIGGQVTVTCAKTGYSSVIDFLTKPFYGGKKHQIQGTISGPDKKTLYTIDGDWNGTMFIKGTKKEILIATQSTPTIRKQVRPLVDQADNESRRLWREVTYFLRTKQIDRATSAKQKIEQMQREMVKYRKENNIKWQSQNFVEDGENWVYVNPLVKRLQQQQQQQQQQIQDPTTPTTITNPTTTTNNTSSTITTTTSK